MDLAAVLTAAVVGAAAQIHQGAAVDPATLVCPSDSRAAATFDSFRPPRDDPTIEDVAEGWLGNGAADSWVRLPHGEADQDVRVALLHENGTTGAILGLRWWPGHGWASEQLEHCPGWLSRWVRDHRD